MGEEVVKNLYEYLVVLDIEEELRDRIITIKKEFYDRHKIPSALIGKPNVTLARFESTEMLEPKIMSRLQLISSGIKPFSVELQNFGSYPMHSLFINIINQGHVNELVLKLKGARTLMKRSGKDPHFVEEPLVPVAIRLWKEKYKEVITEYSNKKFYGKFHADSMLLLKRGVQENKYKIAGRFQFECLPVINGQGVLF
jgi:2'-5' RNA ligase